MRLSYRSIGAAAAALLAGAAMSGCQGSNLPMPPNGPNGNFFSTNNALLRIVDGSPNAGIPTCIPGPPGSPSCVVDISIDGASVATGVPYGAILPYLSFPGGQALIQIYQGGTTNLVFEGAVSVKAGNKYSFVLGGEGPVLPPPAPPFWPGFLFNDGTFLPPIGGVQATFHNASINAGSIQFSVTCTACPAGGQNIGNPSAAGSTTVGPANLIASGGYTLKGGTGSVTPAQLDGLNTGNQLPDPRDPLHRPNVSVYAVDAGASYILIGTLDSNG